MEYGICELKFRVLSEDAPGLPLAHLLTAESGLNRLTVHSHSKEVVMRHEEIVQLLEYVGQALSAGDFREASACWEVPALVLSDEGANAVSDTSEIEKFFAQAAEWYRSQGIASTKPEIERVEVLSEKLAAVDVRWPSFDASGQEKSSERSHYIVQLGKDNQVHIRVALTRKM
jgi:hypothetical protein